MPLEVAKYWIDECKKENVKALALSGGETSCYPHLFEVIRYARKCEMTVSAAFSGWGFTEEYIDQLVKSGISSISISLNGSSEEINSLTREGYQNAIAALELVRTKNIPHVCLNWVMHSNNIDDFPEILSLAEYYHVELIDIIGFKPDSNEQMLTAPSFNQMEKVKKCIVSYKGPVKIAVEPCYSAFRSFVMDSNFLGCINRGINRGCRAGQSTVSVTVDGRLTPCRHLHFPELFDTLEAYFHNSVIIKSLSECWKDIDVKCANCRYLENCKPCQAINYALDKRFFMGNRNCAIRFSQVKEKY